MLAMRLCRAEKNKDHPATTFGKDCARYDTSRIMMEHSFHGGQPQTPGLKRVSKIGVVSCWGGKNKMLFHNKGGARRTSKLVGVARRARQAG